MRRLGVGSGTRLATVPPDAETYPRIDAQGDFCCDEAHSTRQCTGCVALHDRGGRSAAKLTSGRRRLVRRSTDPVWVLQAEDHYVVGHG